MANMRSKEINGITEKKKNPINPKKAEKMEKEQRTSEQIK